MKLGGKRVGMHLTCTSSYARPRGVTPIAWRQPTKWTSFLLASVFSDNYSQTSPPFSTCDHALLGLHAVRGQLPRRRWSFQGFALRLFKATQVLQQQSVDRVEVDHRQFYRVVRALSPVSVHNHSRQGSSPAYFSVFPSSILASPCHQDWQSAAESASLAGRAVTYSHAYLCSSPSSRVDAGRYRKAQSAVRCPS